MASGDRSGILNELTIGTRKAGNADSGDKRSDPLGYEFVTYLLRTSDVHVPPLEFQVILKD